MSNFLVLFFCFIFSFLFPNHISLIFSQSQFSFIFYLIFSKTILWQRKLSVSNRNSLLRIIAIASAGSGLLYANSNSNSRANVAVKVPVALQESISLPWPITQYMFPRPSLLSSDQWQSGMLPLFSSRVGSVPSSDIKNDNSEAVGGDPKPRCNCLGRDTIANAAARVGPAVVNLWFTHGFGFYGITNERIGSGTIIDQDGTILTCAHIVDNIQGKGGSVKGKVCVTLQDGRTFVGTIVGSDSHSDVAIVKIHSKTPLPAATLGSSSKLRPGDWVVAIGCPFSLHNTISAGIVSCVDRKSSDLGQVGIWTEYLQTDCATNVGNSGGPVVNVDGEIIGVHTMKVVAAHGLSFAVPVDSVSKIIQHFKKSGRVVRPWLGLRVVDLDEMMIAQLKGNDITFPNVNKGVLVPMVTRRSPADRAGFRPDDVVIEFDGKPVESIEEIVEIMGDRVGVPMKVAVKRAKDNLVTLTVIPEEFKSDNVSFMWKIWDYLDNRRYIAKTQL